MPLRVAKELKRRRLCNNVDDVYIQVFHTEGENATLPWDSGLWHCQGDFPSSLSGPPSSPVRYTEQVISYSLIIQARKETPQRLRFWTRAAPNTEPSAASEEHAPDWGPHSKPPAPEWGPRQTNPSSHRPSPFIQEGCPLGNCFCLLRLGFPLLGNLEEPQCQAPSCSELVL